MTTYVIIGDGAAGIAAAMAIRGEDPAGEIVVLSDDSNAHYYRAALTNYLMGQLEDDQLWGVPAGFYERQRIRRIYTRVVELDPAGRLVRLESGSPLPYDRLLIASGASPRRLAVPGAESPAVMTFRTLRDARRIADLAPDLRHAVVVGAGTLGLEWAQGLRHLGVEVTYLIREDRVLPGLLDATASEIVLERLREAGVRIALQDEVAEVRSTPPHTEALVATVRGRQIACGLLGVAIGVQPNVGFVDRSALAPDGRLTVDTCLRTRVPDIYAAGDVAHVRDTSRGQDLPPAGLWQPARQQGRVAGLNMVGKGPALAYEPGVLYRATHLYGLGFGALGETDPPPGGGHSVMAARSGPGVYRKVVLRSDRLVGALFIGDRSGARQFKELIDRQIDVGPIRERLLDPRFALADWLRSQGSRQPDRDLAVGARTLLRPAQPPAAVAAPPDRAPASTARLVGPAGGVELLADVTKIGRAPSNDVIVPGARVSRLHAQIVHAPSGEFYLYDLGSSYGTRVNRIEVHQAHRLDHGDQIEVGLVRYRFELRSAN